MARMVSKSKADGKVYTTHPLPLPLVIRGAQAAIRQGLVSWAYIVK